MILCYEINLFFDKGKWSSDIVHTSIFVFVNLWNSFSVEKIKVLKSDRKTYDRGI